jgi:hypothetical protein
LLGGYHHDQLALMVTTVGLPLVLIVPISENSVFLLHLKARVVCKIGTMDPPHTAIVHVTCVQKCWRSKGNGRDAAGFAEAFSGLEDDDRVSERHKTKIYGDAFAVEKTK